MSRPIKLGEQERAVLEAIERHGSMTRADLACSYLNGREFGDKEATKILFRLYISDHLMIVNREVPFIYELTPFGLARLTKVREEV